MQSTYKHVSAPSHVHTETTADYALADYQADIKKILLTEGRLLPVTEFFGEGEGQLSGSVLYDILYTDADGAMCSLQLTSEYELALPVPRDARQMIGEVRLGGVSVRLSGPRKVSVKATVCADVRFPCESTLVTEGDAEAHAPVLREQVEAVRYAVSAHADDRVYTDAVPLDAIDAEQCEILMTAGSAVVHDVTVAEGCVRFDVDMTMQALLRAGDGTVCCIRRTVSAQESAELPELYGGMHPVVTPMTPTVAAVLQTDADGRGECQLTAHVSFLVCAEDNTPLTMATDGYVCDYETDNSYTELSFEEYVQTQSVTLPVSVTMEEDAWDGDPLREIVYTTALVKSQRAWCEGGHACVEGEVQVSAVGVCFDEQGRRTYAPVRLSCPYHHELPASALLPAEALAQAQVQIGACDCTLDDGRIVAHVQLCAHVHTSIPHTVRCLCRMDIRPDAPIKRDGSVITVYYPRRDEELWDIARAYRTTVQALAQDNGLVVETSSGTPATLPARLLIF